MSIFEDLIEELKEENLLEETVIEVHREETRAAKSKSEFNDPESPAPQGAADFESMQPSIESLQNEVVFAADEFSADEEIYAAETLEVEAEESLEAILLANADLFVPEAEDEFVASEVRKYPEVEKPRMVVSEKEYFRKRAMDEVTGLQMVDHVLSGVEREHMRSVPKPYDDLPVKLALHDFLQVAHETNSTEHAQSEFKLMQETENWYSALSHRDKNITVSHLRRFCETTRPALSVQALIALARFYRNSPYSEAVRSKFDLILTRLFSHEIEFEQRELLLDRDEMIQQLKELYADWSSIQLYSADEEDEEIVISATNFEEFIKEVENTGNFEELINNDFFNRLRMFKETCQENFFAPFVAAAAVEANVRIGNRYIELLQKEKQNSSAESIEEKYGFLHDQSISDATGKTFELVELLHERSQLGKRGPAEIVEVSVKDQERSQALAPKAPRNKLFAVNKYLLAATILTVVVCVGLFFWAENEAPEIKPSINVQKVNLENSEFKDYIQTARITDETFFGITMPSWESMNSEKKEEFLKKILSFGSEKSYKKVQLINSSGRAVGYASAEKVEVYNQ